MTLRRYCLSLRALCMLAALLLYASGSLASGSLASGSLASFAGSLSLRFSLSSLRSGLFASMPLLLSFFAMHLFLILLYLSLSSFFLSFPLLLSIPLFASGSISFYIVRSVSSVFLSLCFSLPLLCFSLLPADRLLLTWCLLAVREAYPRCFLVRRTSEGEGS